MENGRARSTFLLNLLVAVLPALIAIVPSEHGPPSENRTCVVPGACTGRLSSDGLFVYKPNHPPMSSPNCIKIHPCGCAVSALCRLVFTPLMRVQLLTNNVARIFDTLEVSLEWWLNVLDDAVTGAAADFVAVHLQVLANSTGPVARFSQAVRARFPDYWCSGLICSSPLDSDFTALGCLVLVRRSVGRDVAVWDFNTGSGGWKPVATLNDPLLPEPSLPDCWCRHSSFARDLIDTRDSPNWTKRGWLHTRWRVEGQPLELLNVHLFDDVSHLRALRRRTALSASAVRRHEALRHALEMLAAAGPAPAALGPKPPATCVFGGFNFRSDARSVLTRLAGELTLAAALDAADSVTRVAVAVESIPHAPAAVPPAPLGWWPHVASQIRCCLAGGRQMVIIEPERLWVDDALLATLGTQPSLLQACDLELAACGRLLPPLAELEVGFPPTCDHAVGSAVRSAVGATAASDASLEASLPPPVYDGTRGFPSWGARVLLDTVGMRLMRAASDVRYSSHEQWDGVRNEHDVVHLAFTIAPASTLGNEPIPVHVKADVAPPIPLKVKCVAVGAG